VSSSFQSGRTKQNMMMQCRIRWWRGVIRCASIYPSVCVSVSVSVYLCVRRSPRFVLPVIDHLHSTYGSVLLELSSELLLRGVEGNSGHE
jgi:hypothetical protein